MMWHRNMDGERPEDLLPQKKYRLWGQQRFGTPYVLVIDKYSEIPGVMKRVKIENGDWYWCDGPLYSHIIYWTEIENAPFDYEAIKQHKEEMKQWLRK